MVLCKEILNLFLCVADVFHLPQFGFSFTELNLCHSFNDEGKIHKPLLIFKKYI